MKRSKTEKVDTQPSLTPKLRFPKFREGALWQQSELRKEATILKGKGISKSDVHPGGSQPCIRYGELYTHYNEIIDSVFSKTNVPANELFLSRANDVIIPSSGETKIDIATASCVLHDNIALGGDLNVIRSNLNGPFLSYYLNGPKRIDIARVAQGDTVVHLYPYQLEGIEIVFPSTPEQKKIADCLTALGNLIRAENQKLSAFKAHKKGLMQQFFPREGEKIPRVRFPVFGRKGAWRERQVSEILKKVSIPIDVKPDKMYREIGVRSHGKGIFHKAPISGTTIGDKRVFRVIEGALVLNIVFAWEQSVATTSISEKGMIASHRFPMFTPIEETCDVRFLKHVFLTPNGKRLLGIASPGGAGRNRTLGQQEFEQLKIIVPCKEEQERIAKIIDGADFLIASQQDFLNTLKAHKNGLMQQLFPPPAEPK